MNRAKSLLIKRCPRCNTVKPRDAFRLRKANKGANVISHPYCRPCERQYNSDQRYLRQLLGKQRR